MQGSMGIRHSKGDSMGSAVSKRCFPCPLWTLSICAAFVCLMPFTPVSAHRQVRPADAQMPEFVKDARLDRLISIEETGVPLEELLQKVSDCKLTLSCAKSCAPL